MRYLPQSGHPQSLENTHARVAELADAQDLKSCVLTDVRVQVPPRVLEKTRLATVSWQAYRFLRFYLGLTLVNAGRLAKNPQFALPRVDLRVSGFSKSKTKKH